MKALFSLRSLLQFAVLVMVHLITGAMGYDISGILGRINVLGDSTLV